MKDCFVYKLGPELRHLTDLIHSLQLLQRNYLDRFPTDVLVFHEGAFPQQLQLQQNMVESASPHCAGVPIKWVRVFHQTPPDVGLSRIDTSRFSLNYRHMIRFMMNELFRHPALDGYDYLCRIDTDSFIQSPVQLNIFDEMRRRNAWYGFMNDTITEVPEYTVGLYEAVEDFLREMRWGEDAIDERIDYYGEGKLYYTNFEVCKVDWFRGAGAFELTSLWPVFFAHMDKTNGIYYHRWSDCTMRYLGVNLFMPQEKIMHVDFIDYNHQGHGCKKRI